jgi:hypothetical protein
LPDAAGNGTCKFLYSSDEGDKLIGWHVNRGPDQAADFYPAETFRSTFHKPDLIAKALDKADAGA